MNEKNKIILVGALSIVLAVPLWYSILGPNEFSFDLFGDPNLLFWLLFGFTIFTLNIIYWDNN
ncbi:hypothetical protein [Halorubrum sp. FL23]|uniref:hypothetical protein n=1 Tax=Halorubrum sp. FL23 TaxID=3458704 RepID=UPI004033E44B